MNGDCKRIENTLSDYVDGLSEAEKRTQLEQHLQSCANCAEALRQTRALVQAAGQLGGRKAPIDLWPAVRQRLPVHAPRRLWFAQWAWRPAVALPSMLAVLAAGLLLNWLPSYRMTPEPQVSAPVLREYAEQRSAQVFSAGDAFVFAAEVESAPIQ